MDDRRRYVHGGSTSQHGKRKLVIPKQETLDYDMPCDTTYSQQIGDNVSSSSRSNARSLLIEMGFSRSVIERVIDDKGEHDIELLLEALMSYSDAREPNFQSSDSLNAMRPPIIQPKQEPDVLDGLIIDKRASLLAMKFPLKLVDFALDKLGKDAPIDELVDFITAAQIAETHGEEMEGSLDGAENFEQELEDSLDDVEERREVINDVLFETMDKTLRLLEMGFSDNEVSLAVDRLGCKAQVSELADTIFTDDFPEPEKLSSRAFKRKHSDTASTRRSLGTVVKDDLDHSSHDCGMYMRNEDSSPDNRPRQMGKRSKDKGGGEAHQRTAFQFKTREMGECSWGKTPKQEDMDASTSSSDQTWLDEELENKAEIIVPNALGSRLSITLDETIAKPPYFFYGNVSIISPDLWLKISQFLYRIPPEFVNTQSFSALRRKEGYIHNLPTSTRFRIAAKPLLTIQDAIPQTKIYWPTWDARSLLSRVSSNANGASDLCRRLEKLVADSSGLLSLDQQRFVRCHCETSNLLWLGPCKLGRVEPEHLERILGYPVNYTRGAHISLTERMRLLEHCFQVDTIGYQLSVLKSLFAEGLTVLSLFTGIGGALIALARLGIRIKGVVSIEPSETKRWVVNRWWQSSGQSGELVEIDSIKKLTTKKLESLMEKFSSFDLIVCDNPCSDSASSNPGKNRQSFDFTLFYEFVRVVQRVRSMTGNSL